MLINAELLQAALSGYQAEYARIQQAMAEIRRELGSSTASTPKPVAEGKKRTMSAAARKRIAAAQKKRWAEFHSKSKEAPVKKKRKLSAAGRARIVEATKRRWAAVRAQKAGE